MAGNPEIHVPLMVVNGDYCINTKCKFAFGR